MGKRAEGRGTIEEGEIRETNEETQDTPTNARRRTPEDET